MLPNDSATKAMLAEVAADLTTREDVLASLEFNLNLGQAASAARLQAQQDVALALLNRDLVVAREVARAGQRAAEAETEHSNAASVAMVVGWARGLVTIADLEGLTRPMPATIRRALLVSAADVPQPLAKAVIRLRTHGDAADHPSNGSTIVAGGPSLVAIVDTVLGTLEMPDLKVVWGHASDVLDHHALCNVQIGHAGAPTPVATLVVAHHEGERGDVPTFGYWS